MKRANVMIRDDGGPVIDTWRSELHLAGFRPGDRVVVMAAEDVEAALEALRAEYAAEVDKMHTNLLPLLATEREAGRVEAAEAIAKLMERLRPHARGDVDNDPIDRYEEAMNRVKLGSWRAFLPGTKGT